MKFKISKRLIKKTSAAVRERLTGEELSSLEPIDKHIINLSGIYFWLPVFNMLKTAKLFDDNLIPGKRMCNNGFVAKGSELKDKFYHCPSMRDRYFLLTPGLNFLHDLMREVAEDYIAFEPKDTL